MEEFMQEKKVSDIVAKPLDEMFQAFCLMDPISKAKKLQLIPLSQVDKWLEEAEIVDMVNVTTTDTGLCFFKFRKRAINYEEFLQFLEDLANVKKLDIDNIKWRLQICRNPSLNSSKKKKKKT